MNVRPEKVGLSSERLARIGPAVEKHIGEEKLAGEFGQGFAFLVSHQVIVAVDGGNPGDAVAFLAGFPELLPKPLAKADFVQFHAIYSAICERQMQAWHGFDKPEPIP